MSQDVPLQPIKVRGGADRHLQPADVPEGGFDSVVSPCWNRQECKVSSPKQEGLTLSTTPTALFALLHVFDNLIFATFENIKPKLKLIGTNYFRHILHNKT